MAGGIDGFTPLGPVEANRGVRARVCSAGKVLEGMTGEDKHRFYYIHYMMIVVTVNDAVY